MPGTSANTVIIPPGTTWTPDGPCTGIATGAQQVMTSPSSISVAPGGAVSLSDSDARADVGLGRADDAVRRPGAGPLPGPRGLADDRRRPWSSRKQLLQTSGGCPGCVFPDDASIAPIAADPDVAYRQDLSDAVLERGHALGRLRRLGLQRRAAAGRDPGRDGRERHGLLRGRPARGAPDVARRRACRRTCPACGSARSAAPARTFSSSDLTGTGLTPVKADALVPGCAIQPPVPQHHRADVRGRSCSPRPTTRTSTSPTRRSFVTAGNSDALRGANLTGIHLAGASFEGFPADLESTTFDNASLQGTHMDLADLRGATFRGAQANSASFTHALLSGTDQNPTTGAQFTGAHDRPDQRRLHRRRHQQRELPERHPLRGGVRPDPGGEHELQLGDRHGHQVRQRAHLRRRRRLRRREGNSAAPASSGPCWRAASDNQGGFDFTNADLTGAKFENAQCVACNFTQATLTNATATGAYMPGAQFTTAIVQSASFDQAWLYCGYGSDTQVRASPARCSGRWRSGRRSTTGRCRSPRPRSRRRLGWTSPSVPTARRPTTSSGCAGPDDAERRAVRFPSPARPSRWTPARPGRRPCSTTRAIAAAGPGAGRGGARRTAGLVHAELAHDPAHESAHARLLHRPGRRHRAAGDPGHPRHRGGRDRRRPLRRPDAAVRRRRAGHRGAARHARAA